MIKSLNFHDQLGDPIEAETLKQIYTLRIKKLNKGLDLESAIQYLAPLASTNLSVALAQAEQLFLECRYKSALSLTQK